MNILKSLGFAATAFALAFPARAVDPVAVWSGDFDVAEKSGLTLNLNGNTRAADNSYVEITGNNGVMVSGGNVNHSTVLIKYSNLDWSNAGSGKVISLLTHKCGAKTEANCSGIAVASDGVLHGIWVNNKWSTTTGGPLVAPSDASAKVSLACTFVSAAAAGDEGTRAFYKNESGVVSQVYDASGLRGTKDNTVTTDWSIGGHYGTSTGTNVKTSATGMKIYGIAIFDKWLTQAEVAAYSFPDPAARKDPYAPGETIVWKNTGTTAEVKPSSSGTDYVTESNLDITIPASNLLPAGSVVRIQKVRLASVNSTYQNWADNHSDAGFIRINNVVSKGVNGVNCNNNTPGAFLAGTVAGAKIESNDNTNDWALNFEFENNCELVVGTKYAAASGNSNASGFALCHNNGNLLYGSNHDWASVRYVKSEDSASALATTTAPAGYYPVYEITAVVVSNPLLSRDATIDGDATWSTLWEGEDAPVASTPINLTVSSNSTLTFDETTAFKSLKLIGSADLMIDGITSANAGLIAKINVSSFTGKLRFEIDASAGLTADATLRNFIRTATGKVTFVFKSTVQNKGVTIDYGDSNDGTQLATHIIFEGGAHSMKYRCENAGLKFGANATADNPTIRVTNNATLTFAARNLCGWTSGNSNANGIIRVDNGSKLNLNPTGGTLYWAQQFYLEPGAQLTYTDGGSFRINGGTDFAPQIFVPDSYEDMTATPAKIIRSGNNDFCVNGQGTKGMAISVGTNTKLIIEGGIALDNANCDVVKLGGGVLAVTGNIANQNFIVNDGSVSLSGSITKLTFNANGVLNLDNGAPTITGELSTSTSKQLALAIAEPAHMMPVITLPEAADKTGWTAIVNGNTANPCDLVADGNTLKLKWKVPPTIEVEADDVTIETADDWNGGVVTIDLGGLNAGDYEDDIVYRLKFGDKEVTGSAENGVATFELGADDFTAGNIYRGTFELEYGTGNEPIVAAEVTVYAGEKKYETKEGWINEHPEPLVFRSTGIYSPEDGASVESGFIKFSNPSDIVFTPTNSPADYVAKCDSEVTFEIFSGEEAIQDDDDTVAADLQAGVKIVDNGSGVKFQFISGDAWFDGPAAKLNTTYAVTVKFHYAKEEGDTDSVTYEVKDLTQEPVVANRRANTAEKLETISFADGTQIGSFVGKCEIEVADPVTKGIEPGADEKELKATDETAAQAEAEKIPVLVPSEVEGGLTEGLDDAAAAKAKADYKARFQVVAKQGDGGKWIAVVEPTLAAIDDAEKDVKELSEDVLTKVVAIPAGQTEGTASISEAVPGFFYGVAEDGEVVNMKTAEPDEWKMAGASGTVELKVTKPANAKSRFYKVICSPLPKK